MTYEEECYQLEQSLRADAQAALAAANDWPAEKVAATLTGVADSLERIRRKRGSGIDATMGKRSGRRMDV